MSSVGPNERGAASGITTMLMNTGRMLSIAIAFPLVLSQIPTFLLYRILLYGGGLEDVPHVLAPPKSGIQEAFFVAAVITAFAAIISFKHPSDTLRSTDVTNRGEGV